MPIYNDRHFYTSSERRRRYSRFGAAGVFAAGRHLANLARQGYDRAQQHFINRGDPNRRSSVSSFSTLPPYTQSESGTSSSSNSMVKGSYGTYHSTSAGRFGATRPVRNDATMAMSRRGFVREQTRGGSVTDGNCVYLGHTSFPPDRSLYIACMALVRAVFLAADIDFESELDVIPPIPGIDALYLDWIDNTQTVNGQTFTWVVGTGTVADLAFQLFTHFKSALQTQARRSYRRLKLGAANANGLNFAALRVSFNLMNAKVRMLNTSYLKVQNSTTNTHGGTGDVADEEADNVNAIPLKGMAYFGKGTWTGLEPYQLLGTLGSSQATVPFEVAGHPEFGFMTMRGVNTSNGIATPRPYWNPPPAKQMQRCRGSSYVTLEPGCMKSDSLVCDINMYFNQFLGSIFINGYTSSGNSEATGLYGRSALGHYKLFALEKKIHSSQDNIVVRYECNQIIRASMYLPKASNSMVMNEIKYTQVFPAGTTLPPP